MVIHVDATKPTIANCTSTSIACWSCFTCSTLRSRACEPFPRRANWPRCRKSLAANEPHSDRSAIYSQRWIIEIFFRFFKQFLGYSHLISHSQNGIKIQTYCAIIGCLLINLWTGRKPTKRIFETISYCFMGLASESELIAHLEKLKRHDVANSMNQ
jgi:hypothetical protein